MNPSDRSQAALHPPPPARLHNIQPVAKPRRRGRLLLQLLAVVLVIGVGIYFVMHARTLPPPGMAMNMRNFSRSTPVTLGKVVKGELKIYLTALGNVTPISTTTVRSRADGQLMKIYFTEDQIVKQGDLLAEIDPRAYQVSLEQAEGQLMRDKAQLDNANHDLERYKNAREAVTQQQVDTAQATVEEFRGAVQTDQGSVDNYKLQLSYCRIIAPITGRVGLRLVDEGNLIKASDATGIVVITQEQPMAVIFSIPEDDVQRVRKARLNQKTLDVSAYDRAMKTMLSVGEVSAMDNQIDPATGTVRMRALFKNDDYSLFPNQFVNIKMLVEVDPDATLVPTAAVQLNAQARFVYVVKADSTVERRAVTLGDSEDDKTKVLSGLQVGETVATEGLDRLQDGAKVVARSEDAAAAVSAAPRIPPPGERRHRGGRGGAGGPGGGGGSGGGDGGARSGGDNSGGGGAPKTP